MKKLPSIKCLSRLFAGLICFGLLAAAQPATAQQQWNPSHAIGTVSGQYDFSYTQTPGQLTEIHPAAIPNTSLTYQWYSSASPTTGFTAISGATQTSYTISSPLSQTTYYRRKTHSATLGDLYSNTIKITVVSASWEDINYIREHDIQTTAADTWQAIDQLPIGKKQQTTTYLDGLGRPLQKVGRGTATPASGTTWGDRVQFFVYDPYGRQPKQYLPYTTTTNPGKYKTDALTAQPQYYTNVYNETAAYSNITYDNSPLNRTLNVKEPGTSWAAAPGNSADDDMNSAGDSVQIFSVDYVQGHAPLHTGAYAANSLYKSTYTDENGKKIITYTDKAGRLILKKIQLSNSPATGHNGWICTYSVYDDFGLLRYNLQPEAVNYLIGHSWSFSGTTGTDILNEQCFQYNYDDKKRLVWKKAPGQEPLHMIYDSRDRLVFTQDGNQAALSTPQWTGTLYDELDRPVLTTLYNTSKTVTQLQADIDNAVSTSTVTVTQGGEPIQDLVVNHRDPGISVYKARGSITFAADAGGSFSSGAGDEFVAEIDPAATTPTVSTTVAVFRNPITAAQLSNPSVTTVLKYQFYDDYSSGSPAFATNFDNTTAYPNGTDILPITASGRTTGFPTGSKVRVLGTNTFLTSTYYYDEKGHLIQSQEDNIKEGRDVTTYQYHFDGRLLSTDIKHTTAHTGYTDFGVLTKYLFDQIGRTNGIQKKIGTAAWKTLSAYDFDDMGRLKTKHLDPGYTGTGGTEMETLDYSYNIHNQITGVNKDYALKTSGVYHPDDHFFGFYLGYDNRDNAFSTARLDGHVAGQMWNSRSDEAQRRYDYTYDNAGRISGAAFTQYTGGAWNTSAGVNFTVSGLSYDANGNIRHLNRYGLKGSTSQVIDNLSYVYKSYSNQLNKVTDAIPPPSGGDGGGGDFHDGSNGSANDYVYDDNGNLISDANKKIAAITYNHLDLPEQFTITGKGKIRFVYDADGNKLQKIVTDNTGSPSKTTTTSYVHGFIYNADTLLYFPTEEGRIRYIPPSGGTQGGYTYDYFVRDHLGDVRMVLTEQTDFSQYVATMEPANTAKESALFYNVDQTRTAKPQGYPEDETTTPNTAVARLNAREPDRRIGPSIILKVMAGDTLQAAVRGYYHQQGTAPDQPSIPAEEMVSSLLAALPGLAGPADPGHQASAFGAGRDQGPRFTAGDLQQLKEKDPQTVNNQKPRAYLNYVFFDNQLNFVEEGSGVKQVQAEPDVLETLSSGQVVAKKSGYVYVYTSNESQQDVLFDNLVVTQSTGPILEETHYYPFGQTMAGISTLAPLRLENRFKYNGKELNHLEFSDGVGLDIYDYGFRNYDPQVGRFIEQDPITDNLATLSPYQYAANDPIANIDVDGLVPFGIPCPGTSSLAIFFEKVGAGVSQFANSPLARALSISVHTLQDAGMVQNAISTSNMINNAFTAVGVGIASKTGNTGGSWPHPIHIRSFAPYETFGGGFEGDSRGYSTALGLGEGGSVTSRVQYAFSVDPSARTFNVGHVWSNESRHPILGTANATPNDKANITGFSSSMDKEGNSTVSFTANLSAANPLTEPLSPDIDVHTKFTLTENERKGTLNVNVVQTGDAFPSAEVFIGDTNGNQLFIGVSPAMGNPYTSLRGDNHRPMISVKFTVTMDKKGVFTSVIQGNKTYTLNQWKKLMQSQPTTK